MFNKITKVYQKNYLPIISDLRFINIKTALQAAKECAPNRLNVVRAEIVPALRTPIFSPRSVGVEIGEKAIIGRIQQEPIKYVPIVNPRSILPLLEDEWHRQEIGLPSLNNEEKQVKF